MASQKDDGQNFDVKVTLVSLSGIIAEPRSQKLDCNKIPTPGDVKAYVSFPNSLDLDNINTLLSKSISGSTATKYLAVWEDKTDIDSSNETDSSATELETGSTVFPITLEQENESSTLSPELININIGVCKGQESIHFGVSTFVVSGQEMHGQILDLPVQRRSPVQSMQKSSKEDTEREMRLSPSFSRSFSSIRTKVSKTKPAFKSLFKMKSKDKSFKNHHEIYQLASNAILRIKVNVTESMKLLSPRIVQIRTGNLSDYIEVVDVGESYLASTENSYYTNDFDGMNGLEPFVAANNSQNRIMDVQEYDPDLSVQTEFIVSSVKILPHNERYGTKKSKYLSTNDANQNGDGQNLFERVTYGSRFCGIMADFESCAGDDYSDELYDESRLYSNGLRNGIAPNNSVDEGLENETLEYSKMSLTENNDMERDGISTSMSDDDNVTVGQDTIDSVKNAKETLRRFADRVGVEVSDLIHNSHSGEDQVDGGDTLDKCESGTLDWDRSTMDSRTRTIEQTLDDCSDDDSTLDSGTLEESTLDNTTLKTDQCDSSASSHSTIEETNTESNVVK